MFNVQPRRAAHAFARLTPQLQARGSRCEHTPDNGVLAGVQPVKSSITVVLVRLELEQPGDLLDVLFHLRSPPSAYRVARSVSLSGITQGS